MEMLRPIVILVYLFGANCLVQHLTNLYWCRLSRYRLQMFGYLAATVLTNTVGLAFVILTPFSRPDGGGLDAAGIARIGGILLVSLAGLLFFSLYGERRRLDRGGSFNRRLIHSDPSMARALMDDHPKPRPPLHALTRSLNVFYHLEAWEIHVPVRDLPPAFDGFAISLLADTHVARRMHPRFREEMFRLAGQLDADLIVLGGDLHFSKGDVDLLRPHLGRLAAPEGVVAVYGNHDHKPLLEGPLREAGIRILHPGILPIERNGRTLRVAGIPFNGRRVRRALADLRREIPPGEASVLVSHTPDIFPAASRMGWPLTISGHTHGGQIRIPGIGSWVLPSRYGRRYAVGLFSRGDAYLYVSPGAGGHFSIRIGCPPEITRIVLRCPAGKAAPLPAR